MKKTILLFCISFLGVQAAHSQLVDVIVEEYGISGGTYPVGHMTYRVYARLQDPTDFMSAVYGIGAAPADPDHTLVIGAIPGEPGETIIWNSPLGGLTGPNINTAFCGFVPESCYDSFLTIGRATSDDPGSPINVLTTPPNGFDPTFTAAEGGPSPINDGAWFALTGDVNGFPTGVDNRVLLMQVTCPIGSLRYAMNIQVFDDGNPSLSLYFCHTMEGEPGLIGSVVMEEDFNCKGLVYPIPWECPSCTDPLACNYDPLAQNDINCIYSDNCEELYGCTEPNACNYSEIAVFFDGTCDYSCFGCIDVLACNFNAVASVDDGTCLYNGACWGCMDPTAVNYDAIAIWDDGTCSFNSASIVFYDTNGNGSFDFEESGLNGWSVYVAELNATLFSDEFGYLYLDGFAAGDYTLTVIDPLPGWGATTPMTQIVSIPSSNFETQFGFSPEGTEALFSLIPYNSLGVLACVNGFNLGLGVINDGAAPIVGVLTLNFDPLLTVSVSTFGIQPDVIGSGFVSWNIVNELAGSYKWYNVHINGPGVDYLGQSFSFETSISLTDEEGEFYSDSWTDSYLVACSYDPNDKQAEPEGYAEPHFMLPGERIEYTIRFQNTGNYPAEDVVIVDQLDASVLDISTFELGYGTAAFYTCLHDDGLLEFMFMDINLPDSVSDEPNSHGLVTFSIEPLPTIPPGTEIHNTAEIYFDQNPAIITNTTWHTIFDCTSFSDITGELEYCEGESATLNAEQVYVEDYSWSINGNPAGNTSEIEIGNLLPEEYVVQVAVSNPLCGITSETELTVHASPDINAGNDVEICAGESAELMATGEGSFEWDNGLGTGATHNVSPETTTNYTVIATNEFDCSGIDEVLVTVHELPGILIDEIGSTLSAPDGMSWQWFLNDEAIDGATAQNYQVLEDGYYSVFTTNEFGCSATSEILFVVGVDELNSEYLMVYPNPVEDLLNVLLPRGIWTVELLNAQGKIVMREQSVSDSIFQIDTSNFASGIYNLKVSTEGISKVAIVVVN